MIKRFKEKPADVIAYQVTKGSYFGLKKEISEDRHKSDYMPTDHYHSLYISKGDLFLQKDSVTFLKLLPDYWVVDDGSINVMTTDVLYRWYEEVESEC